MVLACQILDLNAPDKLATNLYSNYMPTYQSVLHRGMPGMDVYQTSSQVDWQSSPINFGSQRIMLNSLVGCLHGQIIPSDHFGKDMIGKCLDVKCVLTALSLILCLLPLLCFLIRHTYSIHNPQGRK